MRQAVVWQGIIYLSSLAALVVTLANLGPPLRPLVIFWFLLICPGMALVPLLRLRNPLAEWTLAIALSVALEAILAGAMVISGLWFPTVGLVVLVVISVVGSTLRVVMAAGLMTALGQAGRAAWRAVTALPASLLGRPPQPQPAAAGPRATGYSRGWSLLAVNVAVLLLVASQVGRREAGVAIVNVTQPPTAGPTLPPMTETPPATFENESAGLVEEATLVAELSATPAPTGTDTPPPSLTPTDTAVAPPTPIPTTVGRPSTVLPTGTNTAPPSAATPTPPVFVPSTPAPPGGPGDSSPTPSPTTAPTTSPVSSPTFDPSATPTRTPTLGPTPTRTPTLATTATHTPAAVPSATRTSPRPATNTPRPPTLTPTPSYTAPPSATLTPSVAPSSTQLPTATNTVPTPTNTPLPAPSDTPVPLPTATFTPTPTEAIPLFWTLSGRINGGGNDGYDQYFDHVGGVTILISNGSSTTSDSNGYYTTPGLLPGAYVLVPVKGGCDFSPSSRSVLVVASNISDLNFRIHCGDDDIYPTAQQRSAAHAY